MVKYFMSRLIYFQEPESKISCHITLMSVISGLSTLYTFTTVVSNRGLVSQHKDGIRGYPQPQLIF